MIGALVELNPLLGALGGAVAGAAVGLLAERQRMLTSALRTREPQRSLAFVRPMVRPRTRATPVTRDRRRESRSPTGAEDPCAASRGTAGARSGGDLACRRSPCCGPSGARPWWSATAPTGRARSATHVTTRADLAAALRELGFEVIEKHDVGYNEMLHAVIEFGRALQGGGVGLFYYAGHGVQLDGKNYLIPTDASLERAEYVPVETLDLDQVLARMDAARNRLNVVVLDACRDNPFARSFRSVPRGLTQALAPSGTFLAYATAPGDVAADGDGRNSPYAEAILTALKPPGLALEEVFKRVRMQVRDRTGGQQTPWTSSSVVGDFYFRPPVPAPVSPVAAEGYGGEDIIVWNAIKDSVEPHDLRTFLELYPDSPLAPFALARLQAFGAGEFARASLTTVYRTCSAWRTCR